MCARTCVCVTVCVCLQQAHQPSLQDCDLEIMPDTTTSIDATYVIRVTSPYYDYPTFGTYEYSAV